MQLARVTFHECLQDSQELATDDEHMVSRISFTLEVNGHTYTGLYCTVKQVVGASFESDVPLEVGPPLGTRYRGPFNHQAFAAAAEDYYRESFGSRGSAIRIAGGANIRMRNNRSIRQAVVEFPVSGPDISW
jgi:hypothetical protein